MCDPIRFVDSQPPPAKKEASPSSVVVPDDILEKLGINAEDEVKWKVTPSGLLEIKKAGE